MSPPWGVATPQPGHRPLWLRESADRGLPCCGNGTVEHPVLSQPEAQKSTLLSVSCKGDGWGGHTARNLSFRPT